MVNGQTTFLWGLNKFAQCVLKKLLSNYEILNSKSWLLPHIPEVIAQALSPHKITDLNITLKADFYPRPATEVILSSIKTAIRILSLNKVNNNQSFATVSKDRHYSCTTEISMPTSNNQGKKTAEITLKINEIDQCL